LRTIESEKVYYLSAGFFYSALMDPGCGSEDEVMRVEKLIHGTTGTLVSTSFGDGMKRQGRETVQLEFLLQSARTSQPGMHKIITSAAKNLHT
jgi:hypothetical protein